MPRVAPVFRPEDFPKPIDDQSAGQLAALFAHLCPGVERPEIDDAHAGIAIAARSPALALELAKLSRLLAVGTEWSSRQDLREVAIQTVNQAFGGGYAFDARVLAGEAAGLSRAQQGALVDGGWVAGLTEEQRLVADYARDVVRGKVRAELFMEIAEAFGEKGAVECTAVIAYWAFWAMFLNATGAGEG